MNQETVKSYVEKMCLEIGTTEQAVWDANNKAWYFVRGSISIEVFLNTYELSDKSTRTFLRVFSPIFKLPESAKQLELLQGAIEANAQFMGVKIGTMADKGWMYAISERDIIGMDYAEFVTVINDLGYWADKLDDFLQERFGYVNATTAATV